MLDCYSGMSYLASYSSNQLNSLDYNLKAINIAEQLRDTSSLSTIYNNLGAIYKRLDNYELALEYFEKSILLEKMQAFSNGLAICYSNVGILKLENQKVKEAGADYQKILQLLPKVDSDYVLAYLYLSLSGYYNAKNSLDSTKYYTDKAKEICLKDGYHHILARVYRKQGEMFLKQKKYGESIALFDKSLDLSNSLKVQKDFPEIYKKKAEAFYEIGLPKKAYKSLQLANSYSDSLKSKKVADFLSEFESQKAQNEIDRQKLELAHKKQLAENTAILLKNKFYFALLIIILLILLVGIIVSFYVKSKRSIQILKTQHTLINDQKKLLEENIQKLEISEANLQKLNATKDKFFSIIAHDLKSPFNAILGFNNELSEHYSEYSDIERVEMIECIGSASKATYSLLENLLTWSRSQSGVMNISKEIQDFKPLVLESIAAYQSSAELKDIKVSIAIDDNLKIWGDKETLKIVISNLFNNAIKFCYPKGTIQIFCESKGEMLEICIQDDGIGMSDIVKNGLFKIEQNVQRSGTAQEKGTGLGLLLCQEFVQKNEGAIWVKSTAGKGSQMYFSLPLYLGQ
jgi:signal transduction histidine kinase/Tfp pilus assembly protein PilF